MWYFVSMFASLAGVVCVMSFLIRRISGLKKEVEELEIERHTLQEMTYTAYANKWGVKTHDIRTAFKKRDLASTMGFEDWSPEEFRSWYNNPLARAVDDIFSQSK